MIISFEKIEEISKKNKSFIRFPPLALSRSG